MAQSGSTLNFVKYLLKRMILGKRKREYFTLYKPYDLFPTNFIQNLSHSTKNSAGAVMNVVTSSRRVPQILSDF